LFNEIFAGKIPPPRLKLLNQTMPISCRAIDVHGTAMVAAARALESAEEAWHAGTIDDLVVSVWVDRLAAEQRAFLQSVLRYNDDTAKSFQSVISRSTDRHKIAAQLVNLQDEPKLRNHRNEASQDSPAHGQPGQQSPSGPADTFDQPLEGEATDPVLETNPG